MNSYFRNAVVIHPFDNEASYKQEGNSQGPY